LFEARKRVAKHLKAKGSEIVFCGSTTEANNIFIKGIALETSTGQMIYSTSDHSSIVEPVEACKSFGVEVVNILPNEIGQLKVESILEAITEKTKLICFSYVNSETGAMQEVRKIVLAVKEYSKKNSWAAPKVFVDATQAVMYENIDVSTLLVDGMSFSGSKIGSVPGCAVLYVRNGTRLKQIISGGGQEEGIRSGTENLPAIVALSETLDILTQPLLQKERRDKVNSLRNYCIQKIQETFKDGEVEIFGDTKFKYNKYFENAAPHILLLSLVDMLGEEILLRLDAKGISVSTASACSLLENSGSNFLKSIKEPVKAKETIRLSFSENNTTFEIDYFVKCLKEIYDKYLQK
jgi:cysteine desulfurase